MNQTLKVSLAIGQLVSRDGFACQDEDQRKKPLGSWMAKVNAFSLASLGDDVRELQSQSQEELDALLPSVLDKSFKGNL